MREKAYICDDCGKKSVFASYVKARKARWAISNDYKRCFCPLCAPAHRHGAAMNAGEKNAGAQNNNQITFDEFIKADREETKPE